MRPPVFDWHWPGSKHSGRHRFKWDENWCNKIFSVVCVLWGLGMKHFSSVTSLIMYKTLMTCKRVIKREKMKQLYRGNTEELQDHQREWCVVLQPMAYSRLHQTCQRHSRCIEFQICRPDSTGRFRYGIPANRSNSVEKSSPEDTPQLLEHHCVVIRTNPKFTQVDVLPYRMVKHFVAPDITGGMIPGNTEAGPGRLRGLQVSRTFVRRHYGRKGSHQEPSG